MIPGRRIKIVVVDDPDGVRSTRAIRFLMLRGYDVEQADVSNAIETAIRHWADIVVVTVPGTSIRNTLQNEIPHTAHMKVIEV